jgi:hypothetical protein
MFCESVQEEDDKVDMGEGDKNRLEGFECTYIPSKQSEILPQGNPRNSSSNCTTYDQTA